ncbi:MAG: hypothetical protein ABFD97_26405, partial [Syntrophobacter sp.]
MVTALTGPFRPHGALTGPLGSATLARAIRRPGNATRRGARGSVWGRCDSGSGPCIAMRSLRVAHRPGTRTSVLRARRALLGFERQPDAAAR